MQVLISAGEASGDMHASAVIRAMSELEPGVRFSGIAGKCMRNAGCSTLIPINELNVMGFGDVITVLPRILRVENAILSWAKEVRPAAAVLVDFPGFHMRLGHKLRQLDIPVLQYIAPKLWSWGKWRVQKLEKSQDRLACILPFEPEWFSAMGIHASYVGNPSAQTCSSGWSRDELCRILHLDSQAPIIGLFPGSRQGELKRHIPIMTGVLKELDLKFHGLQAVVPVAPDVTESILQPVIDCGARLIDRTTKGFALPVDAAIAVSGTATLELALWGVPTVIIYRSSLTHIILGRWFARVKHIGLANIILDDQSVMPELIQGDCTLENIMEQIVPLLNNQGAASIQRLAFAKLRRLLGSLDSAQEVAGQILTMVN